MDAQHAGRQDRSILERINGVEQLRIPKRCNWFVLIAEFLLICIFLPLGTLVARRVASGDGQLWLILFLIMCGLACLQSVAIIACQFAGAEVIRADRTGLETSISLGGLQWRQFYRAEKIRDLASSDPRAWDTPWPWPITGIVARPGAIKFNYDGWTIYAASLADEPEGPLIIDWLRQRLRSTAIGTP